MKVRFQPSNIAIEFEAGMTLFEIAQEAGLPVGNSCGAEGTCGRCGLRIVSGSLPPPSAHELKTTRANRLDPELRLSCMVLPDSDVEITADCW